MKRPTSAELTRAATALGLFADIRTKRPSHQNVIEWLEAEAEKAEQDEEDDRADDAESRRECDLNDAAHNGSR